MNATESLLLVLDNDRRLYEFCMAKAQMAHDETHPEESEGIWTHEQAEVFRAADWIKDYVEELIDDTDFPGQESKSCVVAQLVRWAFDEVTWNEVAEHYLDKLAEQSATS